MILDAADQCIATSYDRLMLFMPLGSVKSTYGSDVVASSQMEHPVSRYFRAC
ncbi:hypothetical protein [Rhizobium sp. BK376]|uniref:hypothetical protein n=1 Tax=Rhizobium sp. BK376 TaxID=2512149 RepID=UPI0010EACB2F|nr:hypothetical protein [Rhizobium sp. BK376]TCR92778.1 hypothetical protein EV561_101219 [Rhizobium sp. BK376]